MKKGWPTQRLGDVCKIIMGQSPDGESYNTTGEGVPLINGPVEFSAESFGKTIRTKFTTQPTKFCKEGDLILCVRGSTTGRMNIAGFDACVGRGVAAIRAKQYQPWINYFISLKRDEIHGKGTGATFPNVSGESLANFELVVPPLTEQQRIVGILDEAFDGIARAKANAEKNLQNARALFESHLQSVFTQRGKGWVEKKLKEVCEKITDGTHQTPKYFDEGIVFLSSRNVTSGSIDWERIKYIDTKQHLEMHKRVAPRRNDILLAKNGTTGVAAIVDRDTTFDIYVSLALLRTLPMIRPRFLLHFINSPTAKVQFNKRLKGVGVPNLHLEEIREVRLAIPIDLKEQDRVIDKLDSIAAETQRLESIYRHKLAVLGELKKSLLHQAFSGQL